MLKDISTQFLKGEGETGKGAAREILGCHRSQGKERVLRRGKLTRSSAAEISGNMSSLQCSTVLVMKNSLVRLEIPS